MVEINISIHLLVIITFFFFFCFSLFLCLSVRYEPQHEKTSNLHICENKGADQLRGNREADQRHCFRYTDSTIPLLRSKIQNFQPLTIFCACTARFVSDLVGTQIVGFLTRRLISFCFDNFRINIQVIKSHEFYFVTCSLLHNINIVKFLKFCTTKITVVKYL